MRGSGLVWGEGTAWQKAPGAPEMDVVPSVCCRRTSITHAWPACQRQGALDLGPRTHSNYESRPEQLRLADGSVYNLSTSNPGS